ncbi:MAG: NUMOD4 domain-containing protein [Cetobacterium sp.]
MEKWKRYKDTKYFVSNLGRVFSEHKMKTFK